VKKVVISEFMILVKFKHKSRFIPMKIDVNAIKPLFFYRLKMVLMIVIMLLVLPSCGQRGQKKSLQELDDNVTTLYQQGRYSEAANVAKEALKVTEETFGSDHPNVAISLNKLAELYIAKGNYAEIEPLYKRMLNICENAFGPDHPDVAVSLNKLAELYYNQGRYTEAEPLYKNALDICEKSLGPDHSDVATTLKNMAVLYKKIGKDDEAEKLLERAKEIHSKYQ
jgi:tetratricopeptide (TPR) repeat protein